MLTVDHAVKSQIVDYLAEHEIGEFTSSWLSSELGLDDLRYVDSDDQDIHVAYALQELVDECRLDLALWGECPCGADCYRTPDQGSPRCLSCGFEAEADTPVYRWRGKEPEPLQVSRRPRLRKSPLAARLG